MSADAVAKRYRPWPKGLRTDSLPWFDSPLVQGASRLRYTDKAQVAATGPYWPKGARNKKKFLPLIVSWPTVKVRVWVAKLHTDQTVGSSVMKARVVTVSGVTWTFSEVSHSFGCGDHGGVGSLSTGSPSGRGSGRNTPA